jgi:hypothetical protein
LIASVFLDNSTICHKQDSLHLFRIGLGQIGNHFTRSGYRHISSPA